MRGGELVLALVVSKLIYIYSKSQNVTAQGENKNKTRKKKDNLAFKYLVDIVCCQDVAKYQVNIILFFFKFFLMFIFLCNDYIQILGRPVCVLPASAKKCEH